MKCWDFILIIKSCCDSHIPLALWDAKYTAMQLLSGAKKYIHIDVVVQFYPWFQCYFSLLLAMVMYDNEFETKKK